MALLSRMRNRPVQLTKAELLTKAIAVARKPGSLTELPSGERNQVDQVAKALQVGASVVKAPRSIAQMQNRKPVSAAVLAARAHATLGPSAAVTPVDIAEALQQQGMDWVEPFSPGEPLQPYYGYGRQPRTSDYRVGRNTSNDTREDRIPFATLKRLYDGYDIAQICTRHAINGLRSMRIRFEAMDGYGENPVKEIAEAKKRLRRPDGRRTLKNFLAQNMLDLWRYDSAPIYRQRDRAGNVKALKNISAPTIAPMINYYGDLPDAPAPAFQQFIEGIPWDWLTLDDIIYQPFWPQTEGQYGTPPLETVLINANTDVRLQLYFLQFFTAGTVPEAFAIAPEDMTSPDDIADFQEEYADYANGDQAERYGLRWLPHGTELEFYKPQMFDPDLAEYVMRRTVAAYLQTPHDLGFTDDVNRAAGETQMDVQFRVNELPTCGYYEDIFDAVLQEDWSLPVQMRFDTGGDKEDRLNEAQAHQIYVGMGAEGIDEVREKVLGYPIDPTERVPRFWDSARLGPVPLEWIMSVSGDVDTLTGAPKPGTVTPREFVMVGQDGPDPEATDGRPNQPHGRSQGSSGAGPKAPGVPVTVGQEKRYPRAGRALPGSRHGAAGSVTGRPHNGGRATGSPGYGTGGRGSAAQGTGVKEAAEGITSATGIAGVDLLDPDDELDEREDLKRWKNNATKAVKSGRSPRHFADSTIRPAVYDAVWRRLEGATSQAQVRDAFKAARPKAAGIVVQAEDSGRVLMIQRTPDKHDPAEAYARWEFPGGKRDGEESSWEAARREWGEETGAELPDDDIEYQGSWVSPDGVYQGFVVTVPSEDDIDLDPDEEECSDADWWSKDDLDDPEVRDKVTETLDRITPLLKAWEKLTQDEANYRDAEVQEETCHYCVHRIDNGDEPSTCALVQGTVDREHVCDVFAPAVEKMAAQQLRGPHGRWRTQDQLDWAKYHQHTDTIVDHFTPLIEAAMAEIIPPEVVRQVLESAYAGVEKASQQTPATNAATPAAPSPAQQAAVVAGTAGLAAAPGLIGGAAVAGLGTALAMLTTAPLRLTALAKVIALLYAAGYVASTYEATATVPDGDLPPWFSALPQSDAERWTPEQAEMAVQVAQPGLSQLLGNASHWVREIAGTQVTRVQSAVRDAVENGRPLSEARDAINAIVHDTTRANLIAETEYARAHTLAARQTYLRNRVPMVRWLHQPGACPACMDNAAVSPIPVTEPWPSGDVPVHPHCRCAEAPYFPPRS